MMHHVTTALLAAMVTVFPVGAATPVDAAINVFPYPGTANANDQIYRPGSDGVDFAAITGAKESHKGRLPACADPARRGNLRPC